MIAVSHSDGRRIMKSKFYIPILLVVVLIFGCATPRMYEGPKLPKEQVATLEGSTSVYLGVWFLTNVLTCYLRHLFWPDSDVTFAAVSGGRIEPNYFKYYGGLPPKIEVLPGHNKVFVLLDKEAFRGMGGEGLYHRHYTVWLEFNAEAGHKYKVKAPYWWKKGSLIRVVDAGSGEVVASEIIK
jgi:hypothetical protein